MCSYIFKFVDLLDFDLVKKNYNKFKNEMPWGIEYERVMAAEDRDAFRVEELKNKFEEFIKTAEEYQILEHAKDILEEFIINNNCHTKTISLNETDVRNIFLLYVVM